MAKKSNRETVTVGQPIRTRVVTSPSGVNGGSALAELFEREAAAAIAKADADDAKLAAAAASAPFYTGSADPGTVVGLDGLAPSSETPKDGDSKRPDTDPS
ncbi:MAG TPA: hypothetical protein VMZ53_03780 [Kofleriaceae bacterium]|nr:hypothetical protein [Kofleriaceae bacterium]